MSVIDDVTSQVDLSPRYVVVYTSVDNTPFHIPNFTQVRNVIEEHETTRTRAAA